MKHLFLLIILFLACAANICSAQGGFSKYSTREPFGSLVGMANGCNAQRDNTKQKAFHLGIRGGFNASNRIMKGKWSNIHHYWRYSFNVGVTCDFGIGKKLLVRPGIYYTEKGYHHFDDEYTHLNYLEVPLLAVFQQPIGKNASFEIQVGPFVSCGVGGRMKAGWVYGDNFNDDGKVSDYDAYHYVYIECFKKEDFFEQAMFRRFDAGVNLGLGVNVAHFYIGCAYDISLIDVSIESNRCYMFDVGYTF